MKKLAYFYHTLQGGVAATTVRRLSYLKRFFRVEYVIPFFDEANLPENSLFRELHDNGIPLTRLIPAGNDTNRDSLIAEKAKEYLRSDQPNITIIPTTAPLCRTFAEIARREGTDLVVSELRDQLFMKKELEEFSYLRDIPHAVFPNSVYCARQLRELLPGKWIEPVVNGVPIAPYHDDRVSNDTPVITMIAQLHYQKNHLMFIRAIQRLVKRYKNIKAQIVGHDATMGTYLKNYINDCGITEHIEILGFRADINAILKKTDIYCLTSYWEGMPKTLLEAMERSLPVVTTTGPGIGEIIEDGVDGFKVSPDDDAALAERLERLIRSHSLRIEIGQRGREKVTAHYNLKTLMDDYARMLEHPSNPTTVTTGSGASQTLDISSIDAFPVLNFNLMCREISEDPGRLDSHIGILSQLIENPFLIAYLWMWRDAELVELALRLIFHWKDRTKAGTPGRQPVETFENTLRTILDSVLRSKRQLIHFRLASHLESKEKYTEAATLFKHLYTTHRLPGSMLGAVYFHLGRIALANNDLSNGRDFLEKTLSLIPNHNEARRLIARGHLTANQNMPI